jgi:Orotidine 5'-phosphate decarboxylase / HUMPS family
MDIGSIINGIGVGVARPPFFSGPRLRPPKAFSVAEKMLRSMLEDSLEFVQRSCPETDADSFKGHTNHRPATLKLTPGAKRSNTMMNDVLSESNRVRRLFRERFTFQISIDASSVSQGLAVAEAALKAGATILELGTPLLKYEGVRNVVPIFRQRFPRALLLADMKTMDGGEGEANMVYSSGGNVIDFLASASEATARAVCVVRDAFRETDPAIARLEFNGASRRLYDRHDQSS